MYPTSISYYQPQQSSYYQSLQGYGSSMSPYAAYEQSLSSGLGAAQASSYMAGPTSSSGVFSQIASFAYEIARSVVQSVISFFSPLFGGSEQTPIQSALGDQSYGNASQGFSLGNTQLVNYAAPNIKNPKTWLDYAINWFGRAGDLGHDISNGLDDGRAVLSPIAKGLGYAWDLGKGSFGSLGDVLGSAFKKGLDWVTSLF